MVHLKETPIAEFTATGIKCADGTHYDLDVIIIATGFDTMDGSYTRCRIQGRNGESLQEHWDKQNGPSSYLGMSVPNFPNWFMLTGPMGAFANIPPVIDTQVDFITAQIKERLQVEGGESRDGDTSTGKQTIEARQEAEDGWLEKCQKLAAGTLFTETTSWIFGANVPGKKKALVFYFGGLKAYRDVLAEESGKGYAGFQSLAPVVAV